MKKIILIALAFLMFVAPAVVLADTLTNTQTGTVTGTNTSTNTNTATGGAGGTVGPVTVSPTIVNAPSQSQSQGIESSISNRNKQSQGQQQGQGQKQGQGQLQGQNNDQVIAPSQSISGGDIPAQAPTVFAPNLTSSPEACMGSISGGGGAGFNGISFGLSLGSTWKNEDCEIRMFAIRVQAMGPKYENVLVALLSQNSKMKQAFQDAGVAVPGAKVAAVDVKPVAGNKASTEQGGVIEKKTTALPTGIVALGPVCGDGRPSVIRTGSSLYSCNGWDREGLAKVQ